MKIDDKLVCIKTFKTVYQNLTVYQKYEIYSITNMIYNDYTYQYSYEINNRLWFNMTKNDKYYIEKYFLSLTKQRKLKLEKILKIQK